MSAMTKEHRSFWTENDEIDDGGEVFNPVVALVVVVGLILAAFLVAISLENSTKAEAAPAKVEHVERGETGDPVRGVQEKLRGYGYSVVVDGVFGPQTDRAVRHFQKVNGLVVDGIVGPITSRALGVSQAVRTNPPTAQPAPTPPPAAAASGSWTRCPQWESTAEYFGLPTQFDAIMFRESRCRPDVTSSTGCCKGLLQIHRIHLPKPECDVYSESDLFDPTKNICVASVLYKRSGMSPWAL